MMERISGKEIEVKLEQSCDESLESEVQMREDKRSEANIALFVLGKEIKEGGEGEKNEEAGKEVYLLWITTHSSGQSITYNRTNRTATADHGPVQPTHQRESNEQPTTMIGNPLFDDDTDYRPQGANENVVCGPQNEEQVKTRIHSRTSDSA